MIFRDKSVLGFMESVNGDNDESPSGHRRLGWRSVVNSDHGQAANSNYSGKQLLENPDQSIALSCADNFSPARDIVGRAAGFAYRTLYRLSFASSWVFAQFYFSYAQEKYYDIAGVLYVLAYVQLWAKRTERSLKSSFWRLSPLNCLKGAECFLAFRTYAARDAVNW